MTRQRMLIAVLLLAAGALIAALWLIPRLGRPAVLSGSVEGEPLYLAAPVSGTVTAINEDLTKSPEKINSDAHNSWIVKVKLANPGDSGGLMSAADYEKFIAEEGGH